MALNNIQQGDIWLVKFDPQVGKEIKKTRPAIIISNSSLHNEGLVYVAPLTSWQIKFKGSIFFVELFKDNINNLKNDSFINCSQIKSLSVQRLVKPIGKVNDDTLKMINEVFFILTENI